MHMCPESEESLGRLGTCEEYLGINAIIDPEEFVDPGIQLSCITYDQSEDLKIWTHIKAKTDKDFYYAHQDWNWFPEENVSEKTDNLNDDKSVEVEKDKRYFSFLGLYRKFTEIDIAEILRLKNLLKMQKSIRQIDLQALFCQISGHSLLTIFFTHVKVLRRIVHQMEQADLQVE